VGFLGSGVGERVQRYEELRRAGTVRSLPRAQPGGMAGARDPGSHRGERRPQLWVSSDIRHRPAWDVPATRLLKIRGVVGHIQHGAAL
jgi:hypothetical protein